MATKLKLRVLLAVFVVWAPLVVLSGCNTADNPKMTEAAPPPAPKPQETKAPKVAGKEYGANDRYQKAMEAAHKQQNQ